MACMRHLRDITTLLRALETLGQESLALGCTGVAAMINVCVVLFILAHICGVTQCELVVRGHVVNSFKTFKSDHLRSSSYTPFLFPSLFFESTESSILFRWFNVQIYSHTLNTQRGKRGISRALTHTNFTSILNSCQALALRMTCPYLICDSSPLVWTCYQLDPARSFILGVPHRRHSQASPCSWQDLGGCMIAPSLHAGSPHQQKVTLCWLLIFQKHCAALLPSQ